MAPLPNAITWSPQHDLVTGRPGQWGTALPGLRQRLRLQGAGPLASFNSCFMKRQSSLIVPASREGFWGPTTYRFGLHCWPWTYLIPTPMSASFLGWLWAVRARHSVAVSSWFPSDLSSLRDCPLLLYHLEISRATVSCPFVVGVQPNSFSPFFLQSHGHLCVVDILPLRWPHCHLPYKYIPLKFDSVEMFRPVPPNLFILRGSFLRNLMWPILWNTY